MNLLFSSLGLLVLATNAKAQDTTECSSCRTGTKAILDRITNNEDIINSQIELLKAEMCTMTEFDTPGCENGLDANWRNLILEVAGKSSYKLPERMCHLIDFDCLVTTDSKETDINSNDVNNPYWNCDQCKGRLGQIADIGRLEERMATFAMEVKNNFCPAQPLLPGDEANCELYVISTLPVALSILMEKNLRSSEEERCQELFQQCLTEADWCATGVQGLLDFFTSSAEVSSQMSFLKNSVCTDMDVFPDGPTECDLAADEHWENVINRVASKEGIVNGTCASIVNRDASWNCAACKGHVESIAAALGSNTGLLEYLKGAAYCQDETAFPSAELVSACQADLDLLLPVAFPALAGNLASNDRTDEVCYVNFDLCSAFEYCRTGTQDVLNYLSTPAQVAAQQELLKLTVCADEYNTDVEGCGNGVDAHWQAIMTAIADPVNFNEAELACQGLSGLYPNGGWDCDNCIADVSALGSLIANPDHYETIIEYLDADGYCMEDTVCTGFLDPFMASAFPVLGPNVALDSASICNEAFGLTCGTH